MPWHQYNHLIEAGTTMFTSNQNMVLGVTGKLLNDYHSLMAADCNGLIVSPSCLLSLLP
jgi:hypothetical protein